MDFFEIVRYFLLAVAVAVVGFLLFSEYSTFGYTKNIELVLGLILTIIFFKLNVKFSGKTEQQVANIFLPLPFRLVRFIDNPVFLFALGIFSLIVAPIAINSSPDIYQQNNNFAIFGAIFVVLSFSIFLLLAKFYGKLFPPTFVGRLPFLLVIIFSVVSLLLVISIVLLAFVDIFTILNFFGLSKYFNFFV